MTEDNKIKREKGDDEGLLLKASIVCTVVGLIVLYLIAGRMEADETSINKITNGLADGSVVVKGKVNRISDNENVMIIELEKNEKISVVMFKKNYPSQINLAEGDLVEVTGKVEDYNGEKEIIAENVRYLG